MKKSMIIVFGIVACVCGFIFLSSAKDPILTLQSKPALERVSAQWNRFRAYVAEKVAMIMNPIRRRVKTVRHYIEMDIVLPLYIWFVGAPRS